MMLVLNTIAEKEGYTIGRLSVDGKYVCDTLEDKVRNLEKERKVYGKTAIPAGIYRITLDVVSPTFGSQSFYKTYANGGKLPRLLNVPEFDGILIHAGNTPEQTNGCLLVGYNKEKGKVLNSRDAFRKLYPMLLAARNRNEGITIMIRRISY